MQPRPIEHKYYARKHEIIKKKKNVRFLPLTISFDVFVDLMFLFCVFISSTAASYFLSTLATYLRLYFHFHMSFSYVVFLFVCSRRCNSCRVSTVTDARVHSIYANSNVILIDGGCSALQGVTFKTRKKLHLVSVYAMN